MNRLPPWLKVRVPAGEIVARLRQACSEQSLSTVCAGAKCPNLAECWGQGTATFMILGSVCTRACRFCAVPSSARPPLPDPQEPQRLAKTIFQMGLKYAVLTTVCRDDLPDQGAAHIAACIATIKANLPALRLEILLPDFLGQEECLRQVLAAGPDVVGHNIETVERLSPLARDPRASYSLSLAALADLHRLSPRTPVKSSLMLGLGETDAEIRTTLTDLRRSRVALLTLGQYLRPSSSHRHVPVERFLPPQEFDLWAKKARGLGFEHVASGPLVRSSYHAADAFN